MEVVRNKVAVVKFGSNLVKNGKGIDTEAINDFAAGLADQAETGLVVVTSGAVAAGRGRIERDGGNLSKWDEVTLAQLGSTSVMHAWESAFDRVGIYAGGLQTTHHEIEDLEEGPSLIRALRLAFDMGVVSILNENDALSDKELMELACGGDNDGLASHIARVLGADSLTLFTKKGGIFADDGALIEEVNPGNIGSVRQIASSRAAGNGGRGGLPTKVEAAWEAAQAGIDSSIAGVNADMSGENVTRFVVG